MPDGASTAGELLDIIRLENRDELEKGESFEKLFKLMILQMPEFEVKEAYRWKEWPDREKLTKLPLYDSGIDMVARLNDGSLVAIQCKCYDETYQVNRKDIDKFLAASGQIFDLRWFVATCKWGKKAEDIIHAVEPPVRRIDFHEYDYMRISEGTVELERRTARPLQAKAIESVVTRMSDAHRGQLIMACGTGKTWISLRITERLVPDGGRILFLAPSISLVSQARKEWLRHQTRPLRGLVVCSDRGTGGRGESEDIRVSELECPVTTNSERIASDMSGADCTHVTFCTYQSLEKVSKAQLEHGAPDFDIIIADEAHRTTGVERDTGFNMVHKDDLLRGKRRLYMTATPRLYTSKSKDVLTSKGHVVYDMEDFDRFGDVLYRLTFKEAVRAKMLSDYRIIIMAVREHEAARDLYDKFLLLRTDDDRERIIKYEDVERLLGTAFAINGITEHGNVGRLPRVLGFANSRKRSRAFRDLLNLPDMHKVVAARLNGDGSATMHCVEHLDGDSSDLARKRELRRLNDADAGSPRMLCNVKLFTEGVDVPSLDAVAFLDPRDSKVDVVQAVGRVMRKADNKQFGYIVIPVPVLGDDVAGELEAKDGWEATGRVLRALQSHDGRLPEDPAQFIRVYDPLGGDDRHGPIIDGIQSKLEFQEISEKIYTKVVASSGLARPGQMVTDEIEWAVTAAGKTFQKSGGLAEKLAETLSLNIDENEYTGAYICKIAALLVINACLLHRRLQGNVRGLASLGDVNASVDPQITLTESWDIILERDYAPVFEPAMEVVKALPNNKDIRDVVFRLADRANSVADSLGELGYDHSGPLYHKILGTAKSDSANYTDNVSALMLARLAFPKGFTDWRDVGRIEGLRIMDPACGTGTLLMAALKTIKDHMSHEGNTRDYIHRRLVEDVLCGLDINRHAVQLAACNLTLGAPTIDYSRMHLYTMRHGPQGDNTTKAGSLEILRTPDSRDTMQAFVQPLRSIVDLQGEQVDRAGRAKFSLNGLDVVITNPPFGSNKVRNRKFPPDVVKRMQKDELAIRDELERQDPGARDVINMNSISTFFTPLADRLLDKKNGTLAKVLPVTACTNASGLNERRFLAERFHVERVVTSHDPKRLNFSYKTGIHECLMVCRRHNGGAKPPTEFISLHRMPKNAKEAIEAADGITGGDPGEWGSVVSWPAKDVAAGEWSPVQWRDTRLAETIRGLESSPLLERAGVRHSIGPAGQRIDDAYEECGPDDDGAKMIFHSISSKLRRTIHAVPESYHRPKGAKVQLAKRYWNMRSSLLVAQRFDTMAGRLAALYSEEPSVGKGWVPFAVVNEWEAKALTVWWNSTPCMMMLLNRRGRKLTYPKWSLSHLKEIRIPKPDNPGWNALCEAYGKVHDTELLPLGNATEDPARATIDDAAAKVLNTDPDILAGWRQRQGKEPTINNVRAEQ